MTADKNLETEHVENLSCRELSCVGGVYSTHPSAVVTQFAILQPIAAK